jgi:hypothetical protein
VLLSGKDWVPSSKSNRSKIYIRYCIVDKHPMSFPSTLILLTAWMNIWATTSRNCSMPTTDSVHYINLNHLICFFFIKASKTLLMKMVSLRRKQTVKQSMKLHPCSNPPPPYSPTENSSTRFPFYSRPSSTHGIH